MQDSINIPVQISANGVNTGTEVRINLFVCVCVFVLVPVQALRSAVTDFFRGKISSNIVLDQFPAICLSQAFNVIFKHVSLRKIFDLVDHHISLSQLSFP